MVDGTQRRRQHAVVGWVLVIAMGGGGPGDGHAAVYRCVDGTGNSIFTDSPAQLDQCAPLQTGHASSVTTTIRSVEPGHVPAVTPTAPDLSTTLPTATVPGDTPSDSALSQPVTAASPPAVVPSADGSVRCAPGINPLNPLTVVCGPPP